MVVGIITFVFGFLLTLRAAAALKRFKTGGEQYNNLLGNVNALAQLTLGVINIDASSEYATQMGKLNIVETVEWIYDATKASKGDPYAGFLCKREKKDVMYVVNDCRNILKSLPYCMIFNYRQRVTQSKLPLSTLLWNE